jgi:hypothetical protein
MRDLELPPISFDFSLISPSIDLAWQREHQNPYIGLLLLNNT